MDQLGFAEPLRQADAERDEELRTKNKRSLPIQERFDDRWEDARRLGLGEGTSVYDSAVIFCDVQVGKKTWIGPYVVLGGSACIVIGSTCAISCGVHIYLHDTVNWTLSGEKLPYRYKTVAMSVVSANSIVRENVLPCSVVSGSSARRAGEVVVDNDKPRLVFDHRS